MQLRFSPACASILALVLTSACMPSLQGIRNQAPFKIKPGACRDVTSKSLLVVEWEGVVDDDLDAAVMSDLVVVSQVGCTLKVLRDCMVGAGQYAYSQPVVRSPKRLTVEIDNEETLRAQLPFSYVNVSADLQQARKLNLDYIVATERTAIRAPDRLEGECQGATHYIHSLSLGAYVLDTKSARAVSGDANVVGAEVQGSSKGSSRYRHEGGHLDDCERDPQSEHCGAVVKITLRPVLLSMVQTASNAPPVKVEKYGEGLGRLVPIPVVGQIQPFQSAIDEDPDLLELVQAAQRKEKDANANADSRRLAWASVLEYPGNNRFRALATQRRDAWDAVEGAEAKRAQQAVSVCDQQPKDKNRLDRLLALDPTTVSYVQKRAYQREFDLAYKPFEKLLKDCEGWRRRSTEPWVEDALQRQAERDKAEAAERSRQEEQRAANREKALQEQKRLEEQERMRQGEQRQAQLIAQQQQQREAEAQATQRETSNMAVRAAITVPIGLEGEILRLRWKHFQFSTLRGFYVHLGDMGDVATSAKGFGVGVAGVGWKWHLDQRSQWELGFLLHPVALGMYQAEVAGRRDFALVELGWASPYVAWNKYGVHLEVGARLPMTWLTESGLYAGSPHVSLYGGLGY